MTQILAPTASLERTRELLDHLAQAKKTHVRRPDQGPSDFRRELLHDPDVSALVNEIITLNDGWIRRYIRNNRNHRGIRDDVDGLMSKVLTGGLAEGGEVGGVFAAILNYDPTRDTSFLAYLRTAIGKNSRSVNGKNSSTDTSAARRLRLEPFRTPPAITALHGLTGPARHPVRMESEELAAAVKDAVRFLPPARKPVAEMMVEKMLEDGRWPADSEVAEMLGVKRQRGAQIKSEIQQRLRGIIEDRYPQLAADEAMRVPGTRLGRGA